jgi:hypothetical protein
MTLNEFWDHIAKTKRRDADEHAERLTARLAKLRAAEIIDFAHHWDQALRAAYRWDVWGAAYLVCDGASDDTFHYFCQWLVLQGRDVYKAALKKPDSLAKVLKPDRDFAECGANPATAAWFRATGLEPTDKGYDALRAMEEARHGEPAPMPDLGDDWDHDDDDEMRKRLPRLWALYSGDGAGG